MGSSQLTFQHENHIVSLWILRRGALSEGSQSEILHRHLPSGKPLPSLCPGLPQCSPAGTGWRPESESEQSGRHTPPTRWRPNLPWNSVYSEQPSWHQQPTKKVPWTPVSSEQSSPWGLHQPTVQWLAVRSEQPPCSSLCLSCARVHRLSVHSD